MPYPRGDGVRRGAESRAERAAFIAKTVFQAFGIAFVYKF